MQNRINPLRGNGELRWRRLAGLAVKSLQTSRRLAVTAILVFVISATTALVASPKRVLLVFQHDGYSPASLEFQQSVLGTLRQAWGQDLDFYCEQLESTRLPESRDQALALLRSRYAGHGIQAVIFVGTVPTEILPGVPVIYVGNSPFQFINNTTNRDNSVEVWYKVDINKTIAAARRLQPAIKNVLVITGSGIDDHLYLREVQSQLQGSAVHVEYLADAPVAALLDRVAHLPSDTMVLPVSYQRDPKGTAYYLHDVLQSLALASSVPIYAINDVAMGTGVVGGYVVDFRKTGEAVAEAANQLLRGKSAAQVTTPAEGTATYVFDWRQLKRWGYKDANLPPGSVVEFRTVNLWEQYRWPIVGLSVLMLGKLYFILYLLSTQRKRAAAEASLRSMTGRLLESQDEERRRFARDLHDGTGQHLSAVALILSQVLAEFPVGHENLRELLQDSHSSSRQALDEVRSVSFALHPPLLENLGLTAAISWYLDGLRKRTALKIDFEVSHKIQHLCPEVERALFRIVQESVGNVLRHSGGDRISVFLSNGNGSVKLEIKDNGHGMTSNQLTLLENAAILGVGVSGMRERVRQLNGTFKIESGANGTRVRAVVPILKVRNPADFVSR